ncbi:MAG: Bax inhibitor-1/YccA family protein [Chitinophagaceae bacterium]|nr:Bax inhibitor-1/YccA family protein [Chitinophagaceae bacterium]
MAFLKSGNPALSEKNFEKTIGATGDAGVMTEKGTLNKFGILMILVLGAASFTWKAAADGVNIMPWIIGSAIGGLVVALILAFKPVWASFLAPVYALVEGVFVGGISAYYNDAFSQIAPNIVMQAVGITFGVVIAMFALYRFGVIKATEKFKAIIFTATAGIAVFYLLAFVLRFFNIEMPLIHSSGTWGIVFSLAVVAIAALNLILDFDMIEQGSAMGAPKYMEWYGAFGLLVTIVWLYIEVLRLLSKFAKR